MNAYGTQAMQHWRTRLPQRYSQIPDPRTYFTNLGQEVAQRIADLTTQLAGPDQPGETYLDKVGRINEAAMRAREIVLTEWVLLEPEPGTDPAEPLSPAAQQTHSVDSDWIPLQEDPSHPFWAARNDQSWAPPI
jgi:hypothetical protein